MKKWAGFAAAMAVAFGTVASGQTVSVQVDKPGAAIDPVFYGLMTEEINHSYDGGIYAELIQNRIFQDTPPRPRARGAATAPANISPESYLIHWTAFASDGAKSTIDLDTENPVNQTALTHSLRLTAGDVPAGGRAGVSNDGYWGIPIMPNTAYKASFYARATPGIGPITVQIKSADGKAVASANVDAVGDAWKKYEVTLQTGDIPAAADGQFAISTSKSGQLWLSLVSLFPPTYKDRTNGNRRDIMQLLADMHPGFLRFPGGNYLEGSDFANRWNWKATIGPLEDRAGHMSPWNYRSTDGMGLLEFLEWCEDLKIEPVVAVYAGLHLDGGRTTITGEALKPFVADAIEEIEYITGDGSTQWGAQRVKDGHPQPFHLKYIEVGNEDWLNQGTGNYNERFGMFFDAIKAKYPDIQVISTIGSSRMRDKERMADLQDDHYYMAIAESLRRAHTYDNYSREGSKIFVGEWATRVPRQALTCNLDAAVADGAFLTGLERNADVVKMNCYAPLFVNVNRGASQWQVDLIGFNSLQSYGSTSFYVQKLFAQNRGDVVLPIKVEQGSTEMSIELPPARGARGAAPTTQSAETIFASATQDKATGDVLVKLANVAPTAQKVKFELAGAATINPSATVEMVTGDGGAMNSIDEPQKIAITTATISDASASFSHELPATSVSVIRLKIR